MILRRIIRENVIFYRYQLICWYSFLNLLSHVSGWYILVCEPASKQNKNVHQCCLVVRPRFTYVWSRLQAVNLNHIMPFAFDDKQNIICYMVIKLKYMCLIAYIMKANVNYDKFWRPAELNLLLLLKTIL